MQDERMDGHNLTRFTAQGPNEVIKSSDDLAFANVYADDCPLRNAPGDTTDYPE